MRLRASQGGRAAGAGAGHRLKVGETLEWRGPYFEKSFMLCKELN